MKHFEPLRTYVSGAVGLFMARVRMPETSEPASGSVRQKEASLGASMSSPKYSALTSSEAPRATGAPASPLAPSDVPMPEHPQEISSSIRQPSR